MWIVTNSVSNNRFAVGLVWIGLFSTWTVLCSKMDEEAPVTTVENGQLKGLIGYNLDGEKIFKFFGIPYAKPPINELRFQPPQPDEPWQGIQDATKEPGSCVSRDDFTRELIGSEDCLYLNVYTKSLSTNNSTLKPVMVFIHGGGFTLGSSRPGIYGPDFLLLKDIVLVTINYRLGALGFLSLSDPDLKVYGNMGLKDQNLALKWVQKNIKSFNGDPDNVTIFGNSAGGASVHAHILSPASKGLFHKAILQSGSVFNSFFWGSKDNALQLVKEAGIQASSQKEALEILNEMSAKDIFAAQEKIYDSPYPAGSRPFSAVLETHNPTEFLSKNPVEVMESGNYNHVPIMIGYTDNEGMLLELDKIAAKRIGTPIPDLELSQIIPVNLDVTSNDSQAIARILSKIYSEDTLKRSNDPMTDGYFLVGIVKTAQLFQNTSAAPIYLYRISLSAGLNQLKRLLNKTSEPGTGHSDELGYLFRSELTTFITPGSLEDRSLRSFVELWTNFAIYGNPTPKNSEHLQGKSWTPLGKLDKLHVFDIGSTLEMKEDIPERSRMDVWWKILNRWPLKKF